MCDFEQLPKTHQKLSTQLLNTIVGDLHLNDRSRIICMYTART